MMRTNGAQNDIDCRGCRRVLVLIDRNMGNVIDTGVEQVTIDLPKKIREMSTKPRNAGRGRRSAYRHDAEPVPIGLSK